MIFLATVMMIGLFLSGYQMCAHYMHEPEREVSSEAYGSAEHTLRSYLGIDDTLEVSAKDKPSESEDADTEGSSRGRMTQRVTVEGEQGLLPISGTVTKIQDAYYPGTYEVKFSTKALLTYAAHVRIKINVKKGENVYILTGNKDVGYNQYAVVRAHADNCVEFNTDVIQDYTISTTDIKSAQEAMDSLISKR